MIAQQQTNQELRLAFAEEAEETVRYLLYAEQAQREGHPELSALFRQAAQREALAFARIHARQLGEVGSTVENLANAIRRETAGCTELYPALARHAAAAGDDALAAHLCHVAAAKEQDVQVFRRAYAALQGESSRPAPTPAATDTSAMATEHRATHSQSGAGLPDFVPNGRGDHRGDAGPDDETVLFLDDLAEEAPAPPFPAESAGEPGLMLRQGRTGRAMPVRQGAPGKVSRRWGQ